MAYNDDIERFRRKLKNLDGFEFKEERLPPPFFGNLQPARQNPGLLVVDFGLARTGEPVVLVFNNGYLYDFSPSKDIALPSQHIEESARLHARIVRWLGRTLRIESWETFGVKQVTTQEVLSWDFSQCDILKNLKYLSELAGFMGIKRIGVIAERGFSYSLPSVVSDGVRVKVLPNYQTKRDRDVAFHSLSEHFRRRSIRLVDDTNLLHQLRKVQAVISDDGTVTADDASPVVNIAASLCLSLKTDAFGQAYYPEDVL